MTNRRSPSQAFLETPPGSFERQPPDDLEIRLAFRFHLPRCRLRRKGDWLEPGPQSGAAGRSVRPQRLRHARRQRRHGPDRVPRRWRVRSRFPRVGRELRGSRIRRRRTLMRASTEGLRPPSAGSPPERASSSRPRRVLATPSAASGAACSGAENLQSLPADVIGMEFGPAGPETNPAGTTTGGALYLLIQGPSGPVRGTGNEFAIKYDVSDEGPASATSSTSIPSAAAPRAASEVSSATPPHRSSSNSKSTSVRGRWVSRPSELAPRPRSAQCTMNHFTFGVTSR